ncbi:MAG: hypothetical protein ACRDOY_11095, partial [Nocardioidaceae bacterium]
AKELRAGQRRPDGTWLATVPADAVSELRIVDRADLHRLLVAVLLPGTVQSRAGQLPRLPTGVSG